ncbi:MAG: hypothetical protein OIF51_16615, partial [Cellvibrionaceae bacterium]|nr:hypothetical protein [Cellvibrionaceae bacterium]
HHAGKEVQQRHCGFLLHCDALSQPLKLSRYHRITGAPGGEGVLFCQNLIVLVIVLLSFWAALFLRCSVSEPST